MKFNVKAHLSFEALSAGAVMLSVHTLTEGDEYFSITQAATAGDLIKGIDKSRILRFKIDTPGNVDVVYRAAVETSFEIKDFSAADKQGVELMDPSVLIYLYPSRYCQSDKLYRFAEHLFGAINNPFEQVLTLTHWINQNVRYVIGSTNASTSACDTVTEQVGVCRDFAHLGIALCRALTIPARYFTGYAYALDPPDFHACFEAYIDGYWVIFDPTGLAPLNGVVKIATGRDAADASLANIFGDINLTGVQVNCELADGNFEGFYYEPVSFKGLCYR